MIKLATSGTTFVVTQLLAVYLLLHVVNLIPVFLEDGLSGDYVKTEQTSMEFVIELDTDGHVEFNNTTEHLQPTCSIEGKSGEIITENAFFTEPLYGAYEWIYKVNSPPPELV